MDFLRRVVHVRRQYLGSNTSCLHTDLRDFQKNKPNNRTFTAAVIQNNQLINLSRNECRVLKTIVVVKLFVGFIRQ